MFNLNETDISVLTTVEVNKEPLSAKQISEKSSISQRNTYNVVLSMVSLGFLIQVPIMSENRKNRSVVGYQLTGLGKKAVSLYKESHKFQIETKVLA